MTKCSWKGCDATTETPKTGGWEQRMDVFPEKSYFCPHHVAAFVMILKAEEEREDMPPLSRKPH